VPTTTTLTLFAASALVLLAIPGPAVFYVLARSASQGTRAGLVSVAGLHTGTVVHVAAAVVGLSALLVASATAFTVVKLAGAAYLVYMGARLIAEHRRLPDGPRLVPPIRSMRRVFTDGVVVEILNPKVAVFFLALLPQFVDPGRGDAQTQLLILGTVYLVMGVLSDGAYALLGGFVGRFLYRSPRSWRRTNLVAGTTYVGLGVATAVSGGAARQQ
jgi:threonine/homoserine/homoserine lactone efflux protein